MKREDSFDFEEELIDDFGDFEDIEVNDIEHGRKRRKPIHSDNWTLVDAFNVINEEIAHSKLKKDLFETCAEAFDYLNSKLGFNSMQCVFIAMLIENGKAMSFRQMGRCLGVSRLSIMTHYNSLEELFKARWLMHSGAMEDDGMYEGYRLAHGVVTAVRENRVFKPEELKCKNTQEFVEMLASHVEAGYRDDRLSFSDTKLWIKDLIEHNKKLPICKLAAKLKDLDCVSLLMLVVTDYCNFNGSKDEGLGPRDVQLAYPRETTRNFRIVASSLQSGTHELFRMGLIEHKCEDGMANVNCYVASKHLKEEVLAEFKPIDHSEKASSKMNGMKACGDIVPKTLFYNEREDGQVKRLRDILSQEQLPQVQERLKKRGMRTGVCVLMHGAPGTGKTATAYELARQTGRDIIQVQVTDFKDKYVGESEAKLKSIFSNYRSCCKNSKVIPILLLNEGDAILSKRLNNVEKSVDQMSNALQNILLEEMENLEGIMIVTTNLTNNLDSAFERRFIFKIQFDKPNKEVKARIWKSMIEDLNEEESAELAEMFDISGGEIENIARKTIIEYVISGKDPDLDMVKGFAKEEKLMTNTRPIVGFCH